MKTYAVRFAVSGSVMGTAEMGLTLARATAKAKLFNEEEGKRAERTGQHIRGEYVVHEVQSPTTSEKAKIYFENLLEKLSPEAQRSSVGFYVKEVALSCVNNFQEGRISSIPERLEYLKSKMSAKRGGRWEPITLAELFPEDWKIISKLNP